MKLESGGHTPTNMVIFRPQTFVQVSLRLRPILSTTFLRGQIITYGARRVHGMIDASTMGKLD